MSSIKGYTKKFILVYEVDEYPENGGGICYEEYASADKLDEAVIKIWNYHKVLFAGEGLMYTYRPVETVTKIERG